MRSSSGTGGSYRVDAYTFHNPQPPKDYATLVLAVLGSAAATTVVLVAAFIHFWTPDSYVGSVPRLASVTAVGHEQVSFTVGGQSYPDVHVDCSVKVKPGYHFTAHVDLLKTAKGRVYGALNWAGLKREFCR